MCGIVGAFLKEETKNFPIKEMADAIRHRGPDDEGYALLNPQDGCIEHRRGKDTHASLELASIEQSWNDGTRLVLGHRRLSILDLSAAGHQPMVDSTGEITISYNGEIFNYLELRRELESAGVQFRSGTDTEVIIEAYKMWGEECQHKFNGMWGFALWDNRKKILFCSRDRYGIKPFYYAQSGKDFFFASEIKPLLLLPKVPKKCSEEAVFDFLVLSLPTREPQTFFEGINSLEPGHSLVVNMEGNVHVQRWYNFPSSLDKNSYDKATIEEFRERLQDSIRLRLLSDVPVGSCLSGGLDSSSIVSMAVEGNKSRFKTFTACYEDERFDERKFMQQVVDRTGVETNYIFPQADGFWKEWPELISAQEEPFGSTSLFAHWCVMREAASQNVHVLLNGQGGDELLGGYPRYFSNRAIGELRKGNLAALPSLFQDRRILAYFLFRLSPSFLHKSMTGFVGKSMPYLKPNFLKKHLDRHTEYLGERISSQGSLTESLRSDFLKFILPSLLRYEDKNSMHYSVEVRLPFMDYRLVEWVFGLEESAKVEKGINKRILRDSMKGILPEAVRMRTDKMGWATPEQQWMSDGRAVYEQFFDNFSGSEISRWVDTKKLKNMMSQNQHCNNLLWRIINLEMWLRVFFQSESVDRAQKNDKFLSFKH